jgi:Ethylbenzene dehydrogenase
MSYLNLSPFHLKYFFMNLLRSKFFWLPTMIVISLGIIVSCTKTDTVLGPEPSTNSGTDLVSIRAITQPVLDGAVDAFWENHPKLEFGTAVPEVTGDVFRGFTGNIIPAVTIRSAYDNNDIYFLVEWVDPTQSLLRQPWYFDPTTKKWAQESGNFTFGTSGGITRAPFYEDKIAFLWNVSNSVSGWATGTCYRSCHTGLPAADGSSRHFTNFTSEKIDMWHWKSVRGGVNANFQADDQFQDNTYPNGRKGDISTDGYANNTQSLAVTGVTPELKVNVPKYVIPGKSNYGWILNSEVTDGTAKTITAVDANGVLTLSNGTTIDPNVGTDYQRVGAGVGAKAIPGLTVIGYTGSRGDISCKASYTGTGWILEIKRALKTADAVYDVDFSSLEDQYFGFAIFENAQIAHSIKPGLLLKFQK